jgi:hypothetical protein
MTNTAHPPPTAPPPDCGGCGLPMNRIGKLPAISIKTALHVFRCRGCKAIKTVSLDATIL